MVIGAVWLAPSDMNQANTPSALICRDCTSTKSSITSPSTREMPSGAARHDSFFIGTEISTPSIMAASSVETMLGSWRVD